MAFSFYQSSDCECFQQEQCEVCPIPSDDVIPPVNLGPFGPLPWCRFDDLYGITGNAGTGLVEFSTNTLLDPNKAVLTIYGLGEFQVENLTCVGNDCTGTISGLPIGVDQLFYSGQLSINDGERVCTAPNLLVPPPPKQ